MQADAEKCADSNGAKHDSVRCVVRALERFENGGLWLVDLNSNIQNVLVPQRKISDLSAPI